MIQITEQDFAGEFAEARALLHAADELSAKANRIIRKQVKSRLDRWEKQGKHQEIEDLAKLIPSSVERFFAFQAASRARQKDGVER